MNLYSNLLGLSALDNITIIKILHLLPIFWLSMLFSIYRALPGVIHVKVVCVCPFVRLEWNFLRVNSQVIQETKFIQNQCCLKWYSTRWRRYKYKPLSLWAQSLVLSPTVHIGTIKMSVPFYTEVLFIICAVKKYYCAGNQGIHS